MESKGKLFLIPTYLDPSNGADVVAPIIRDVVANVQYFLVEQLRTARRFVSSLNTGADISQLSFEVLNKHSDVASLDLLMAPLFAGTDMGVMSEAGLPGIADPGRLAVDFAHQHDIQVVPLPGPSSIILALIASGMDGQKFTFHGYIPIEKSERIKRLLWLQKQVQATGATQIFMETPYRNNQLVELMLSTLADDTLLSVASNLTGAAEYVHTTTIAKWKKVRPDLHKKPTIFCLGKRS